MLTATLGGLIKDYRIKKRLSQLEVSLRIGWKDTSRLSKIEQGRVGKPTRETIDKIMDALELNAGERTDMLLVANIAPTIQEAHVILEKLKDYLISEFHSPVILVDFLWNVYYFNDLAKELFQLTESEYKNIYSNAPNWFELQFSGKIFNKSKMRGGYSTDKLRPFNEYLVAHFKFEQGKNFNEKWFKNIISSISNNEEFRKYWSNVKASDESHLFNYEINEFTGIWRGEKQKLLFRVYAVRPAFDFRFAFLIHEPADESTRKFYSK